MKPKIWIPLLARLATAAVAAPGPQAPASQQEALLKQLTEKATDPKALARQGEAANGCRLDERRLDDPKYREGDYRSSGRSDFGSMASETNPIPPELRAPRYLPPASRQGVGAFSLLTERSETLRVDAFKGKVVVLFLFRPDCHWTIDMLNEVIRLQGMEEKAGMKILAVSIGEGGWPELLDFKVKYRVAIPPAFSFYRPSQDAATGLKQLPKLVAAPTTYILDRQGRIAWQILGGIRGALQDKINQIRLEP